MGDAKGVGSALADAEQGAMKLEGALKSVDNVTVDQVGSRTRKVAGEMDHLSDRTDNSRSVMANFVGNGVQTLPGVTGAMGPLNMAIGQFGEYATEGNISLGKLVGTGLAIGAAAAVMQGLSSAAEKQAKLDLWRKGEVDAWTEAVKQGTDTVEGLSARLKEVGEINLGVLNQKLDITPLLASMGIGIDDFSKAVLGGKQGVHDLAEAMHEMGIEQNAASLVIKAAGEQVTFHEQATKNAAAWQKVYGEETATTAGEVRSMSDYLVTLTGSVTETDRETRKLTTSTDAQGTAADTAAKLTQNLADAQDRSRQKADEMRGAFDALTGSLDDEQAFLNLESQFTKFGEAAVGDKQAVLDLKKEVNSYGQEVAGLPASRITKMLADIDSGSVAFVKQQLDALSANRTMQLSIIAKGGAGTFTIKGVGAEGAVFTRPTNILAGEAGTEFLIPADKMPGAFPLPSSLGAGGGYQPIIVNLTVNGSVMAEKDIVRSVYDGIIDGQRRGELVGSL